VLDRRSLLIASAGICSTVLSRGSFAQQVAGRVVLYTSNNTEVVRTAIEVANKTYPDLRILQVTGGTGVLMKRIEAEASNPGGDIFWSGGFGTLGAYAKYFEPYASPQAASIRRHLLGPGNLWSGTNVHVMLIMANSTRSGRDPMPKTWTDLFDLRWKGRIAMTDPSNSSFTYITIYALSKKFGRDGLKKLAANVVLTGTTGQTNKGVADGEYPLGITSEASAYEYIAADQPGISLIYPSEGAVLSPEGAVLLKGAKNPGAARSLYDAFLSKELQEVVLKATYRRPSRSDIQVSSLVKLPEMADVPLLDVDQLAASHEREEVLKVWKDAIAEVRR